MRVRQAASLITLRQVCSLLVLTCGAIVCIFFPAKVEALKRSKEEEEEGRGGQGKRGNLFLLLSSQLSRGTCAETVTTQAMSAMLTCLR